MTDKELDAAEALFRNPPSASIDRELALRVVAYAKEMNRAVSLPAVLVDVSKVAAPSVSHGSELRVADFNSMPTPPHGPAAKKKVK